MKFKLLLGCGHQAMGWRGALPQEAAWRPRWYLQGQGAEALWLSGGQPRGMGWRPVDLRPKHLNVLLKEKLRAVWMCHPPQQALAKAPPLPWKPRCIMGAV